MRREPHELADVMPIRLTRTYRELDSGSGAFGIGMASSYDLQIPVDEVELMAGPIWSCPTVAACTIPGPQRACFSWE